MAELNVNSHAKDNLEDWGRNNLNSTIIIQLPISSTPCSFIPKVWIRFIVNLIPSLNYLY